MLYLVGYDLDAPGQNYSRVISYLEGQGAKRVLMSNWLLPSSNPNGMDLRKVLDTAAGLDQNDRLFVVEVPYNSGWRNLLLNEAATLQLFDQHARRI
jgi:hypothetical protein